MSQFGTPLTSGLIFGPQNFNDVHNNECFSMWGLYCFCSCSMTPFLVPYQINNQGISYLNVVFQSVHLLPIPISSY